MHDENVLVAVLNLGHFFQVEAAQTDARRALEQLPEFRAALRYRLGLKNMIVPWVSSGFRELVIDLRLDRVAVEDIEAMGIAPYHAIVSTKLAIEVHRKHAAYEPPPVQHSPDCASTLSCDHSWRWEWKREVARRLLHPERWWSGEDILEELDGVEVNDMDMGCLKSTLRWVRAKGVLTKEDNLITEAIRSLTV